MIDYVAASHVPWHYAALHGVFILGMSATGLISWRLNEGLLQEAADREERLAEALALGDVLHCA